MFQAEDYRFFYLLISSAIKKNLPLIYCVIRGVIIVDKISLIWYFKLRPSLIVNCIC